MTQSRSIGEFVEILRGFAPERIESSAILEVCLDTDIQSSSIEPFVHWHDATYTRNLISAMISSR